MTAPLNYQPPTSATHYRAATRLQLPRFLIALPAACILAAAGAILYVDLLHRFDAVHFRIASAVCAAVATGLLAMAVTHLGKVRTRLPACLAGGTVAAVAVYAMWLAWVHNLFARSGVTYPLLLAHPINFAHVIWTIHDFGVWSYEGHTIKGFPLLLIWLTEAGMVLAAGVFFPIPALYSDAPVCRDCNKPCTPVPNLPRFSVTREGDLLAAVEARDFASLAAHEPPEHPHAPEVVLSLYTCRHCLTTHILSVSRVYWHINSHGRASVRTTPGIKQLLLTADDAILLGTTCHQILSARNPAPPVTDQSPP